MTFEESLQNFIEKISGFKSSISTEEATKTSVILPFFQLLGYDVFDPTTFVPEFVADVGIKRGEKVDYAILQDGKPIIIIEAKSINRNLERHDSQLFRYFATTSAKFAILTNGIRYRFYTDLDDQNKMDAVPLLDFDLLHIRERQIESLKNFRKENFDIERIAESASDLKYKDQFKRLLAAEIESPSDEFVRMFLKNVYTGMRTQNVIDRFRPLIKDSFAEVISEIMNDKIKVALSVSPPPASDETASQDQVSEVQKENNPPLSPLEQNAYNEVLKIFSRHALGKDLTFKKTGSYIAVLIQNNTRKWICRLSLKESQKVIILPDSSKNELRKKIANIYEIYNYRDYLICVAERYDAGIFEGPINNPFQVELTRRFPKKAKFLPDGSFVTVP